MLTTDQKGPNFDYNFLVDSILKNSTPYATSNNSQNGVTHTQSTEITQSKLHKPMKKKRKLKQSQKCKKTQQTTLDNPSSYHQSLNDDKWNQDLEDIL